MANYHILVRNYHWRYQNTLVQSPVLKLDDPVSNLVIRPLEGNNNFEPRVLDSARDLTDDICEDEYEVEAHGVFVSTESQRTEYFPVWSTVHNANCGVNEVNVVDLTTFKDYKVTIDHICWVPGLEASDDRLYTVIGAPRKILRLDKQTLVIVQELGFPKEAKLVLVGPDELASYSKIDEARKRKLFEIQLKSIHADSGRPSRILQGIYRIFTSPNSLNHGRQSLDERIDEDSSSDDDKSIYVRPNYVSMVGTLVRPYSCECKYAGLRPTSFNPRPSHRHKTDMECSLGHHHDKHCIYADHNPTECVIPSSEGHEHCFDPVEVGQYQEDGWPNDGFDEAKETIEILESNVRQLDMEERSNMTFYPDVEALFATANESYGTYESMGHEPEFIYSPSMESQFHQTPFVYSALASSQWHRMTPLPSADVASEAFQGLAMNFYEHLESYRSPEPQDMIF
ncbi:hypothetical protein F5Y04DRAFT_227389 [Hypomontagnella monticulosa]|nr:hypothetical protein F5Y04DRAFT_227389 [Hypomontagnella monticulosa]